MNNQPDGRNGQPQGYEAPVIQTFSQEEFLAVIGPAQGYNAGTHPGDRFWGRVGGQTASPPPSSESQEITLG